LYARRQKGPRNDALNYLTPNKNRPASVWKQRKGRRRAGSKDQGEGIGGGKRKVEKNRFGLYEGECRALPVSTWDVKKYQKGK